MNSLCEVNNKSNGNKSILSEQAKNVMESGMAFLNDKISTDIKFNATSKPNNNNNNSRGRQSKKQKIEMLNKEANSFQGNDYDETDEKLSKRSRLDLSSLVDNSAYLANGSSSNSGIVDFLKVNTENASKKLSTKQRRNSKQINGGVKNVSVTIEEDNDTNQSILNRSMPIIETAKIQPEVNRETYQ